LDGLRTIDGEVFLNKYVTYSNHIQIFVNFTDMVSLSDKWISLTEYVWKLEINYLQVCAMTVGKQRPVVNRYFFRLTRMVTRVESCSFTRLFRK